VPTGPNTLADTIDPKSARSNELTGGCSWGRDGCNREATTEKARPGVDYAAVNPLVRETRLALSGWRGVFDAHEGTLARAK
jgi:hypothetical protein